MSRKAFADLLDDLTKSAQFKKLAAKHGLVPEDAAVNLHELAERIRQRSSADKNKAEPASKQSVASRSSGQKIKVFIDGAARGNPGPAACAAIFYDDSGALIRRVGKYLGSQTNNFAEYSGLLIALEAATAIAPKHMEIFSDSELLVKQVKGTYKVKSPELKKLFDLAILKLKNFEKWSIQHVPREKNSNADALCNEVLNNHIA